LYGRYESSTIQALILNKLASGAIVEAGSGPKMMNFGGYL
jgi:hypothetical protein